MFFNHKLLNALVISVFLSPIVALASAGKIEKVGISSAVKVNRGGVALSLKEGDVVENGDEISTDARTAVDVRLEDETLIRVGVNSSYKIMQDSKIGAYVHRLLAGMVRVLVTPSDREKREAAFKFRMTTPEGTIGVRGTEFVVIRSEGKTELKGLDGQVLFGPADTEISESAGFVEVRHGFESSILAGTKASSKPQKFDLRGYLDKINSPDGPFGPLTGRGSAGNKRYTRNAVSPTAASAPRIAIVAEPRVEKPAEPPAAKTEQNQKVDSQLMLFQAAERGSVKLAKLALEKGARLNEKNETSLGYTALHIAIAYDKEAVFNFLVKAGADVNMESEDGLTPLMLVAKDHLDMKYALALVNPGAADYLKKNRDEKNAADIAKSKGYTELLTYLKSDKIEQEYQAALAEKQARKRNKKKD